MSDIADKWSIANTVSVVESTLAATGTETIEAAQLIHDAALQRNIQARQLRDSLQQSATTMRARTEAAAALPTLLVQVASTWRTEEAREQSRLDGDRRRLAEASSSAIGAIQSIGKRTQHASRTVHSIQELVGAAAVLEESVDRKLVDCQTMLDEAGALQLQLEEVLREVTR